MVLGGTAYATTITVNSLSDPGASGTCGLRDAITAANTETAVNGCAAGSGTDTILYSGVSGTIVLADTLPPIANTLTISGPTAPSTITIDGGGNKQILSVSSGATLNLQALTLAHGQSTTGGAIYNNGTLNIGNCAFSGNTAADGGAIYNIFTNPEGILNLTVTNSTFSSNSAGDGAAILSQGTSIISSSTFSSNSVDAALFPGTVGEGGAIANTGFMKVTNSTFAGNSASSPTPGGNGAVGGAIENNGGLLGVNTSTFVGNFTNNPPIGAAVSANAATTIKGSILASSASGNCFGLADSGYNLSDDSSCNFSATGSQNGVTNLSLAAGPASNGGPTLTIALNAGSPAINAIPVADCTDLVPQLSTLSSGNPITTDQRGEPRPDRFDNPAKCDIGAYELQETFPLSNFIANLTISIGTSPGFSLDSTFTLAPGSDGIDPLNESVTLGIGPNFSATVPAGSFKQLKTGAKAGSYVFSGPVDGVNLEVQIVPEGKNQFEFKAEGSPVNLSGLSHPSITIAIGNNSGTTS